MKNKGEIVLVGLFILSIFLLAGCVSKLESQLNQAQRKEVLISQVEQPREDWGERWDNVVSSARKEGKLVVYSTTGGEMRYVVGGAFKERYGIGADFLVAKGAEITAKVATERRAGLFIPDVYLGGAQSAITYLKPRGYLDSLETALILPEVMEPNLWWEGKFPWIDKGRSIIGFVAYANVPLAININLVKPEEINSYKDLLKPRWKGKLLLNDVTTTGSGGAWFSSIQLIIGTEFMYELVKQEPAMLRDYRLQLDWLAGGKFPLLVAPHAGTMAEFTRTGAPVKSITPVEGTYRTSGSGNLALFNKAPHLDAAKLFINWLLTGEGQKVYGQVMGYPSARLDVSPEGVEPDRILNPKVKYINGNSEENLIKQEADLKLAQEIFGHLLK